METPVEVASKDLSSKVLQAWHAEGSELYIPGKPNEPRDEDVLGAKVHCTCKSCRHVFYQNVVKGLEVKFGVCPKCQNRGFYVDYHKTAIVLKETKSILEI